MLIETLPRPAERVAIVSLLLVFLCGAALGAVAMSYWFHPAMHAAHPGFNGHTFSTREWKEKLNLTDDQTRQLNSILDDIALYYDNVIADGNTRIKQILNPDQRLKFDQMMKDHRH